MSTVPVSDLGNRLKHNRMSYEIPNRNPNNMSSNTANNKSSSNCVINIDYVERDERISFEVFRSSIDSCVFHKKIKLPQSKSCTALTSLERIRCPNFQISKMVQTEAEFAAAVLPPNNIGPAPFCRNFECPVKDTANSNDISYKESYGVSNFKFPETTNVVKLQNSNFCCLDFDGTRSVKRNYLLLRNKHKQTIHIKRVRSDINIKKVRTYSPSPFRALSPSPFKGRQNISANSAESNAEAIPRANLELNKETSDEYKHKRKKHRVVEDNSIVKLKKKERTAFEFVLTSKEDNINMQSEQDKEKNEHHHKHKHRKIIVTSNTLHASKLKPNMKDEEQQTNLNDMIKLNSTSVNELYKKSNFRSSSLQDSLDSGDLNVSKKKKKREKKKKMTMNVFPCLDIKSSRSHHHLEMSVNQKRPSMPRRRIDMPNKSSVVDTPANEEQPVVSAIQSKQENTDLLKRKGMPRKCLNREDNQGDSSAAIFTKDEGLLLRKKVTNLFQEESSSILNYNQKIDELCGLISCIVHERERSRSRSPTKLKNDANCPTKSEPHSIQNSFQKELPKTKKPSPKVERLKITHNKKDSVTIIDPVGEEKQNIVPRNVLQVSPRANEIFNSTDFKRKNTMVTYPVSMMPDCVELDQMNSDTIDASVTPVFNYKLGQHIQINKPLTKKLPVTKRNCSSVTFSSQIGIIGDDKQLFNDEVNLKNTLFPINESLQRSKTLPNKQDFCKSTSSKHSTAASSVAYDMPSSISNSDIASLRDVQRKQKSNMKKTAAKKSKIQKPGAIENSTVLYPKKNSKNLSSSFQKRKEYYSNLKKKMRNKPESPDRENKIDEISSQTKLLECYGPLNHTSTLSSDLPKLNQTSKSRIPVLKPKREISQKDFILKSKKQISLFPYEFSADCRKENILNRPIIHAYPLKVDSTFPKSTEKLTSPYKVADVKKQNVFLQTYPLESSSLSSSARTGVRPKSASTSQKEPYRPFTRQNLLL